MHVELNRIYIFKIQNKINQDEEKSFSLFPLLKKSNNFVLCALLPPSLGGRKRALRRLNDADNDAKQPERRAENLDNQHLDEEAVLLRVRDGARRAGDADADAADEVGEADEQAGEEEAVAGVETRVGLWRRRRRRRRRKRLSRCV